MQPGFPLLAACLLLTALLSACAAKPGLATAPGIELLADSELPPPTAADFALPGRIFHLGPYDLVRIGVFGVPEMEREIQIDAGGQFEFPLAGTLTASGRTPAEVARAIEDRLRGRYVKQPQVTINLLETSSHRVTVDGEVARPGTYPVLGDMTLMRAVASAEGLAEFADQEDVVVFRTVAGQRYAALYNLAAIRRGNYADPPIYANDVVIVGESSSLRLFDTVARVAPLLTTPILILAR